MKIGILLKKELTDIIRDRRTIISMIIVPLLAIPLLSSGFGFIMYKSEQKIKTRSYKIAVDCSLDTLLIRMFSQSYLQPVPKPADSVESLVKNQIVKAGIVMDSVQKVYRIIYDASDRESDEVATRCEQVLIKYREMLITAELEKMGIPRRTIKPFEIARKNVATKRKMFGMFFGMLIGYLMVILMFSMSSYPAVDLVTGEKERKTIEILLSSPANRMDIIISKLFAVIIVGLISISLYILGYIVSAGIMFSTMFPPEIRGIINLKTAFSPTIIIALFLTILPFVVFAASLEIAIATFARSYKEAQSYISPLIIIVIFPAMAGFASLNLSVSLQEALIPIYNVTQIIKALLSGELSFSIWLVGFLANTFYAALAVAFAFYLFQREDILIRG